MKDNILDLTDTPKHSLTQYSVNNERIRELVLNGGHGSWLTYLPIRLCFLKPQLSFFFVLKASQSDKPPLLPPSGWMMLLSRQPQDNSPPPDVDTLPPPFFFAEWCHSSRGDRQRPRQDTIMQTLTYLDLRGNGRHGCLYGTLAGWRGW